MYKYKIYAYRNVNKEVETIVEERVFIITAESMILALRTLQDLFEEFEPIKVEFMG